MPGLDCISDREFELHSFIKSFENSQRSTSNFGREKVHLVVICIIVMVQCLK